jgi:hypothetical protein
MIRTALCFGVILGVSLNPAPTPAAEALSPTDLVAEHMLMAIGGRDAWAAVTSTVVYSDQYRQNDGTPVGAVSTADYARSRIRIDTTGPNLQQVRIIGSEGDQSWRLDAKGRLGKIRWRATCADIPEASIERCIAWPSAIPSSGSRSGAAEASRSMKATTKSPGMSWMRVASRFEWERTMTMSG